jgi:hypothetical protein
MVAKTRFGLLAFLLILSSISCRAGVDVSDGFEAPTLSKSWSTRKFAPGAAEIQSKVARTGKSALKITLREGDWTEANDYPGGPILERAELEESPALWAEEDKTYAYSFSIFLPQDFPIVPTRLVIAQWKQRCPQEACTPSSPVIAIRYSAGELRITTGPGSATLYRTEEEVRNRWLDFRFQIRFSGGERGRIKAWLNTWQVVDYTGATKYSAQGGYPSRNRFYFKIGLYRDRMPEPMSIYIDDYRKQQPPSGGL